MTCTFRILYNRQLLPKEQPPSIRKLTVRLKTGQKLSFQFKKGTGRPESNNTDTELTWRMKSLNSKQEKLLQKNFNNITAMTDCQLTENETGLLPLQITQMCISRQRNGFVEIEDIPISLNPSNINKDCNPFEQ